MKNKKIILVDMDGVLADLEGAFLTQYRAKFPQHFFLPVEKRRQFYIHNEYPEELSEDIRSIYGAPGFFQHLPMIEGAKEGVLEMQDLGHEVFICTSIPNRYKNSVTEKYLWVAKNFGHEMTKKIIMTKDKTLVHGDILIDDKPLLKGVIVPSWEHILYDAPYNQDVKEKRRMTWDNWEEVLKLELGSKNTSQKRDTSKFSPNWDKNPVYLALKKVAKNPPKTE